MNSFGLTEGEVLGALGRVKVRDVDYADLYFESCVSESVSMEESLVKRATKSVSQGVGVRATAGRKTGFAYSDELTKTDLNSPPIRPAILPIRRAGANAVPVPVRQRPRHEISIRSSGHEAEVATAERVALLECASMPKRDGTIRASRMSWPPLIRNIRW